MKTKNSLNKFIYLSFVILLPLTSLPSNAQVADSAEYNRQRAEFHNWCNASPAHHQRCNELGGYKKTVKHSGVKTEQIFDRAFRKLYHYD